MYNFVTRAARITRGSRADCDFALVIHRIHKSRTRGKKLVPSHESEALEDKQKLQMKTFSELAECLARIPPKITLYGPLFKYNYVACLLLLMFSSDLLFAIKRDAYIFKETGLFCRFPKHQKLDTTSGRWREKSGKHVGPNFTLKPNTKASSLQSRKTEIKADIGGKKKRNKRRIYGLLVNGRDLRHYTKQVK